MIAEVKIYCEGEEIEDREFAYMDNAEEFFETYPLDDMADEIKLFGYDAWDDWEELDSRKANPEE